MPKGRALAAVEVKPGWILDIDGEERTVQDRQYGYPREGETERRIKIWFTDGYQSSGDEGQTVYVISEGEIKMTALKDAQSALENFKQTMAEGHPWMSGSLFANNPGLDQHILEALCEFVRIRQVEENARPAQRVSLSDDPNWRPSSVAPIGPDSKEWVDVKDDDQPQA